MATTESIKSFKFGDLKITLATQDQLKPKPDQLNTEFGTVFSDHMFQVEWNVVGGWGTPQIVPLHNIQMHPAAKVLHNGRATFEGTKAYRHASGKVALFRPELNMKRFLASALRISLPAFDVDELLKCLKKLVSVDKDWVPDLDLSALYIRPVFISTADTLGSIGGKSALLYIITSPVRAYFFGENTSAVSLLADPTFVRAWPGGAGQYKLAANYAPSLHLYNIAREQGLDQVLWLFGEEHQVSEGGAMNVFLLMKTEDGAYELVTPPLDGTILPGVTRKSVIELARGWQELAVSERIITMKELILANRENRLLEIFLCGTAAIVGPVKMIRFKGEDIEIPTMESEMKLYLRVLKSLTDIQYGRVESHWSVDIE